MAGLLHHTFAFFALFSYGIYHLVSATRSFFKPPSPSSSSARFAHASAGEYTAHPYYPLPLPPHRHHLLRHLPLYLAIVSLLISVSYHALSSVASHRFFSLQYAVSFLFFLLLASSLLLPVPLPPDLVFLLAAVAFALLSSVSSAYQSSDLQSKCESLSSVISAASAAFSLALSVCPRLFLAELALASSISLQGLWALQTCLSLYIEGFIPEGCHRLLDVAIGSTLCEIEESRIRAAALLDLAFMLHTTFIAVIAVAVYASFAWIYGGSHTKRHGGGAYEALPTSSSSGGLADLDHVQMKTITKNTMQA